MTETLWGSLAKAQLEMKNPKFDSKNPVYGSSYASLSAVREAVMPSLNKYGISVIQELKKSEGGVECYTTLAHESGEKYMSAPLEIPSHRTNKDGKITMDAHTIGSAATYARRYQLQAICGVVGDPDDDGNHSVKESSKTSYAKPTQAKKPYFPPEPAQVKEVKLTEEQLSKLVDTQISYADKIGDCKDYKELPSLYEEAKSLIKAFGACKETKDSLDCIKSVVNVKKIELSPEKLDKTETKE